MAIVGREGAGGGRKNGKVSERISAGATLLIQTSALARPAARLSAASLPKHRSAAAAAATRLFLGGRQSSARLNKQATNGRRPTRESSGPRWRPPNWLEIRPGRPQIRPRCAMSGTVAHSRSKPAAANVAHFDLFISRRRPVGRARCRATREPRNIYVNLPSAGLAARRRAQLAPGPLQRAYTFIMTPKRAAPIWPQIDL